MTKKNTVTKIPKGYALMVTCLPPQLVRLMEPIPYGPSGDGPVDAIEEYDDDDYDDDDYGDT